MELVLVRGTEALGQTANLLGSPAVGPVETAGKPPLPVHGHPRADQVVKTQIARDFFQVDVRRCAHQHAMVAALLVPAQPIHQRGPQGNGVDPRARDMRQFGPRPAF
ncbi:hypothetical protein D3C71_1804490 [compost metagenome]